MLVFQRKQLHSIKAIMFDMDGTLIDSIDVYHEIIRDIMDCLDMEMTLSREELFENLSQGKNLSDIFFPAHLSDRERAIEQFRILAIRAFKKIFAEGAVELIDGVDHLFEELRSRGFSLAIVTSSSTDVILPFLKTRKLEPYLNCVVGRTEVSRLKPFPDPLLKCMGILDVEPDQSVYVGDSVIDIQAGKAAGTWTGGVLTGTSDVESLKAEGPDVILDTVGDLLSIL
jgi:HAD superfamily hydrolase (TIGR01549 family)